MTYRSFARLAFAPLLAVLLLATGPAAFARSAPDSFADLAEKLLPAVVNIATTTKITDANRGDPDLEELFKQFFDKQRRGQGQGGDQNGDQNGDNGDDGRTATTAAPTPRARGHFAGLGLHHRPRRLRRHQQPRHRRRRRDHGTPHDNAEFKAKVVGRDPRPTWRC